MPGIEKVALATAMRIGGFGASVSRLHHVGNASVRNLEQSIKNGEGDHA